MNAQLKDGTTMRNEAQEDLERAKSMWENKTNETDKKIKIRESQLKTKAAQGASLEDEIVRLKKMLEEADGRLKEQSTMHDRIVQEMSQMEEQRQDVDNKLQQQEVLIGEQNKLLNQEKDA